MSLKKKLTKAGMLKLAKAASAAAEDMAQLVFPSDIYCLGCGIPIPAGRLYSMCDSCLSEISWANGKICAACGKPLEDWYPDIYCSECINVDRVFDGGATCFQYRDLERKIIADFKYHGKSYMSRSLSEIMYDRLVAADTDCQLLVPVPMYREKERSRGYNQAALLAEFTAERLGVPWFRALERVRSTVPMNKLSAAERKKNLDDAFRVTDRGREWISGKHVMLVDDIYTTGTTAGKCAEVLKAAGADRVTVLSLAAGRNQRELPDAPEVS